MFTFCPNCHTIFRLTPGHLSTAGGYTRCGECRRVYSAVEYLYEDLPATREAQGRHRQPGDNPVDAVVEESLAGDQTGVEAPESLAEDAGDGNDSAAYPLPARARGWDKGGLTLRDVASGAAIVFLSLLLATQWVFFNRDDLAREQSWRPGLEQFCGFLQCRLPLRVDLAQLELLNRDVRKHPRVRDALLLNATLSNKADFNQPYPVIEVSFSDRGGRPVAARRFRPQEYVNDRGVIERGMPPGEPVPVLLEILDPGTEALSYQFGFL